MPALIIFILILVVLPVRPSYAAAAAQPAKEWKLAVISDMNQGYGSTEYRASLKAAIRNITSQKTDAVISTGDMVAGQKKGLNYAAMWKSFHRHVTEPLQKAQIPLLPSAGNHDASAGKAFQQERNLYVENFKAFPPDRFKSPRLKFIEGIKQNYPLYYAMQMGPALLVALDATATGPLIGGQLEWLEGVLKKSADYKIKIVFGHVPLYPFAFHRAADYLGSGDAGYAQKLEKLLQDSHVTYYLSGHHHVFYPGKRRGEVHYVSVPLLGTGPRQLLTRDRAYKTIAPEAFLYLYFNEKGEHRLEAWASPELKKLSWGDLPPQISLPAKSAGDCKGCGEFPEELFLNSKLRSVFDRLKEFPSPKPAK